MSDESTPKRPTRYAVWGRDIMHTEVFEGGEPLVSLEDQENAEWHLMVLAHEVDAIERERDELRERLARIHKAYRVAMHDNHVDYHTMSAVISDATTVLATTPHTGETNEQ